ncbi:MAG: hypothetical protein ABI142_09915 [Bryocella sp.]
MNVRFLSRSAVAVVCVGLFCSQTMCAISFGKKDGVDVKIVNGGPLKHKSILAIGAFRVAFKTHDKVVATGGGIMNHGSGSSSIQEASMEGIEQPLMQKIADQIYADFVAQATAKGYTIIDSAKLAGSNAEYKNLAMTANFTDGPLGTFVVPTGQVSPVLATDDYKQENHGTRGFGAAFKGIGSQMSTTEANKVFPKVGKETDAAVIAVTIVVNFATFKGSQSAWMSGSKSSSNFGATIEGVDDLLMGTNIKAWDAKTNGCGNCMAHAYLKGNIHSTESIGEMTSHKANTTGDNVGNVLAGLTGSGSMTKRKSLTLTADPDAYQKNVLLVAQQAHEMLLSEIVKEK